MFDLGTDALIKSGVRNYKMTKNGWLMNGPTVFTGEFNIADENDREDTYWNTTGWGKGFVFVNGFNLGRYWPLAGPQITMYIPRDLLKVGQNSFVIVEQQLAPQNGVATFQNEAFFLN